jgi:hypothetical protein
VCIADLIWDEQVTDWSFGLSLIRKMMYQLITVNPKIQVNMLFGEI